MFPVETIEEALAQAIALGRLEGRDEADAKAMTLEQLQLTATAYEQAGAVTEQSSWDRFKMVLGYVIDVVGPLASVASGFSGVLGAAQAAKGL